MSLQDEFRAQKLSLAETADGLAKLQGHDLSDVTFDAGCNMLFVYLLNRWGSCFEPGVMARIRPAHA